MIPENDVPQLTCEPHADKTRRLKVNLLKPGIREVAIDESSRQAANTAQICPTEVNALVDIATAIQPRSQSRIPQVRANEPGITDLATPQTPVLAPGDI